MNNPLNQNPQPETKGSPVIQHMYEVVSRRYDSFLVATAFLVTAYATVIVVMHHNPKMLVLADAISAVGLYLAFFFTVANFHGSLLIVHQQIGGDGAKTMCLKNMPDNAYKLIRKFLSHVRILLTLESIHISPRSLEDQIELRFPAYVHTWLVPSLLFLFWLILPFCVLPDAWPWTLGVALVPVVLWTILYLALTHSKCKSATPRDDP
jgi:hypothetical protein